MFLTWFGDAAEVTLPNCRLAADVGLNLSWLALVVFSLLSWHDYHEAVTNAWRAYHNGGGRDWYDNPPIRREVVATAFFTQFEKQRRKNRKDLMKKP